MAFDTIRAGIKVFTNARASRKGGFYGGSEGIIADIIRHPVTRNILAVILDAGTGDPDDNVVVAARNLRLAAA